MGEFEICLEGPISIALETSKKNKPGLSKEETYIQKLTKLFAPMELSI